MGRKATTRRKVLTELIEGPGTSFELAAELGLTVKRVSATLRRAEAKGLVTHTEQNGWQVGKRFLWELTNQGRRWLEPEPRMTAEQARVEYNQLLADLQRRRVSAAFVERTLAMGRGTVSKRRHGLLPVNPEALLALRWVHAELSE